MLYYIDTKGYARFSDSHKFVHRWMAEKKLGRKLKPCEVVHHINRDKLDNHPDNLYVCRNQWHHDLIHLIDAQKFGWEVSLYGFKAAVNRTPGAPIAVSGTRNSMCIFVKKVEI